MPTTACSTRDGTRRHGFDEVGLRAADRVGRRPSRGSRRARPSARRRAGAARRWVSARASGARHSTSIAPRSGLAATRRASHARRSGRSRLRSRGYGDSTGWHRPDSNGDTGYDGAYAFPGDARGVGPQAFEAVELAGLGEEDVHDDVAVVDEHPGRVGQAFGGARFHVGALAHLLLDLVDDRAHLTGVRRAGHDEVLDDAHDGSDFEDEDVVALLVVRRVRGDACFRSCVRGCSVVVSLVSSTSSEVLLADNVRPECRDGDLGSRGPRPAGRRSRRHAPRRCGRAGVDEMSIRGIVTGRRAPARRAGTVGARPGARPRRGDRTAQVVRPVPARRAAARHPRRRSGRGHGPAAASCSTVSIV